jgi:hypothetical protein
LNRCFSWACSYHRICLSDSRQLFVEALLSAKQIFVFTFNGDKVRDSDLLFNPLSVPPCARYTDQITRRSLEKSFGLNSIFIPFLFHRAVKVNVGAGKRVI